MSNQLATMPEFEKDLELSRNRLQMLLTPQNITVDAFISVTMVAVTNDPALLDADRQSLINSLMQCAGDGLIPDKRDAFLNVYSTKVKIDGRDVYIKKVQYMPMVRGIVKKIRKDPNISDIIVDVIYQKDHYEIFSGDDSRIIHKPTMLTDRGPFVCAYAIFKYHNGGRHQEVMRSEDINKAKGCAKTQDVWNKWFDEKAKSSVLHRSEKRLDLTPETREFMQRVMIEEVADRGDISARDRRREEVENPLQKALAQFRGEALPAPEEKPLGGLEIPPEGENISPEPVSVGEIVAEQSKPDQTLQNTETVIDQKPEPETKVETVNLKSLADQIRSHIKNSKDSGDLDALWTYDCKDQLEQIRQGSQVAYDFLKKYYDERMKSFEVKP